LRLSYKVNTKYKQNVIEAVLNYELISIFLDFNFYKLTLIGVNFDNEFLIYF